MRVYAQPGAITVRNKPDFLRNCNEIWNRQVKKPLFMQSAACLGFASTGYSPDHGSQTSFVIEAHGEIWFLNVGENNSAMKVITINR